MITKEQVLSAQDSWGSGVVSIGALMSDMVKCEKFAQDFLSNHYAFDSGEVLFKPTKCSVEQFRPTQLEALSYFIAGDNRSCNEDGGFALNPWTKVRFENAGMVLDENRALAMGNYFFTDLASGAEVKVEYTFGYKLVDGNLKIDLHHSSFPYNPS